MLWQELNDKFAKVDVDNAESEFINRSSSSYLRKISEKLTFLSMIHKRTCTYQGVRNFM